MKRVNKAQSVRNYVQAHPTATTSQIAKACKVKPQYVYQVRADEKKREAKQIEGHTESVLKDFAELAYKAGAGRDRPKQDPRIPQFDNVNHPSHYKSGGIETIDFIEAKELGYHLGNVIKYVTRAKHKGNELEDLKKAQWYLNREISKLTGEKA